MPLRMLTLYGRPHCHLCEDMQVRLRPWGPRLGFTLQVIDIESDPVLEERFGEKVPVLMDGKQEICHYFLDEKALLSSFSGA